MKKSAASKAPKTSKTAVIVRELPPNHDRDIRGGMVVTKVVDCASTN